MNWQKIFPYNTLVFSVIGKEIFFIINIGTLVLSSKKKYVSRNFVINAIYLLPI